MRAFLLCAFLVACSSDPETSTTPVDTGTATVDTGTVTIDTATIDTATAIDSTTTDSTTTDSTVTTVTDSIVADTIFVTDAISSDAFGAGCNTLAQKGSNVTQMAWTDPLPTFSGGPIADGTYVLTKWVATDGKTPSTIPVQETISISGGSWQLVANASTYEIRQNATVTTSSSTITYTPTCPAGTGRPSVYTATATEIMARNETDQDISWFTKL